MSFAKRAADELLGDDAEAERQVQRKRLKNLLLSLGILGAGAGGAYYLGKDNGAHWGELMKGLGLDSHQPQSYINRMLSKLPWNSNDKGDANIGITGAGAATGGAIGYGKAPTAEGAHTLSGIVNNSVGEGPMAKHLQSMGGPAKPEMPTGNRPSHLLSDASTASDPVAEINKSMQPLTSTDPNEAPVLVRSRALHTGELTPSTNDRGFFGKLKSYWDKHQMERGLAAGDQMAPGTVKTLPGGKKLDVDKIKADLVAAKMGPTMGAVRSGIRGASRVGTHNPWVRLGTTVGGTLLGGGIGNWLDNATMPAVQTK